MLEYIVDAKVDGISVQLIRSKYSLVVIYGMHKEEFMLNDIWGAMKVVEESVRHAVTGVV